MSLSDFWDQTYYVVGDFRDTGRLTVLWDCSKRGIGDMFAKIGILARVFAAGAVLLWVAGPAAAGTIQYTVSFSAPFGFGAPINPLTGEFSLAFDPASDATGPALVIAKNFNVGSAVLFKYTKSTDVLHIYGDENGVGVVDNTDDFFEAITSFTTAPTGGAPGYSQVGFGAFPGSFSFVTVTATAVTPVPAALPLFASALFGMGYLGWRRKQFLAA